MRHLPVLLIMILLLGACAPVGPATPPAGASAQIVEIENQVDVRMNAEAGYAAAEPGDGLVPGGSVRTLDDSRARLDLLPDGTIVRVGPNTIFVLTEQDLTPNGLSTRLNLLDGNLWIVLQGGSLQVDTESGSASVRGSLLHVRYDVLSGRLQISCLEGRCTLTNGYGTVELSGGQASEIPGPGLPPSAPRPMDNAEINAWFELVPEAAAHGPLGTPAGTPGGFFPPQGPTPGPTRYELTNNCPQGGAWHWLFEGPQIITFDVPPGQTISGELPPGDYYATDFFDEGPSHGPSLTPGGGFLQVSACPAGTP